MLAMSPEEMTCWLPTELCVCAEWWSLPLLQADVPSEWVLGCVSEALVISAPLGALPEACLAQ